MPSALVSIVLAVYKPNMIFLQKQLLSIINQTYAPLELLICDDSADDGRTFQQIRNFVEKLFEDVSFTVTMFYNDTNQGSTATFQYLTEKANGQFISYCDQDDIWEKNKIERLMQLMLNENAVLAHSDMAIIDAEDYRIHESFYRMNKRTLHVQGDKLFQFLLGHNTVTGCTMLICSSVAKAALPFPRCFVHDHFLALVASMEGRIAYCPEQLVRYRIHGNNQIGASMVKGINSRKGYLEAMILPARQRMMQFKDRYKYSQEHARNIDEYLRYINDSIAFYNKRSPINLIHMMRYFKKDRGMVCFEIGILLFPDRLFSFLRKRIRKLM